MSYLLTIGAKIARKITVHKMMKATTLDLFRENLLKASPK